ncbi:hypothetical protein CKO_04680 [Citrobacter koseri ATCC BAA-895]|uniref:Uncharacterized protein n=1 Tax=Citrobacter koseri (strain ATCC BAA-895 / CDC 4225-83 / SGSC4696) TaxID=290338 RepID=A8AQG7_CITK8|nr:hypothetical protein CKO_04680 [Citrobacter koseri ATCC BAA-895]
MLQNVAYVSFSHHFRALHLFFPVYTLHIASSIRSQNLALPLLKRVWPKPQTGKDVPERLSITIISPHRMHYEKDDDSQPGCGRRAACCCKSGACWRNTGCRKEKRIRTMWDQ